VTSANELRRCSARHPRLAGRELDDARHDSVHVAKILKILKYKAGPGCPKLAGRRRTGRHAQHRGATFKSGGHVVQRVADDDRVLRGEGNAVVRTRSLLTIATNAGRCASSDE
jgi:hypothetical protein